MRRLTLALSALLLCCTIPLFAAITDSFTDANGTALATHGSWTVTAGTWTIQSNKAQCAAFVVCKALRSEAAFPNNQYAQIVTQTFATDNAQSGVYLRTTIKVACLSVASAVSCDVSDSGGGLTTWVPGIADNVAFTLKVVVTGTTVEGFFNGVSAGTATTIDLTGILGMHYTTNGAQPFIDDFESTDASGGAAPVPRRLLLMGVG